MFYISLSRAPAIASLELLSWLRINYEDYFFINNIFKTLKMNFFFEYFKIVKSTKLLNHPPNNYF